MPQAQVTKSSLAADQRLRITEIFHSLQGESRPTGCPTVFVRLTGCPLRCGYCDTAYAFHGGYWISFEEIVAQAKVYGTRYICVTGGEPLAQPNCAGLLQRLCDEGFDVSLETSGALPIEGIDRRVCVVMDIKTPDSGESARNLLANLPLLKDSDQLKFVICSREDYEWSKRFVLQHDLLSRCALLFSPSQSQLEPRQLAEWILEDRLQVRLQVQLHKYLWGDVPGH